MTEENKFPMVFDKCPSCGSTKRVVGPIADEEKAQGRISPELHGSCRTGVSQVFDGQKVMSLGIAVKVPTLFFLHDICANCGLEHIVRIERKEQPAMIPGIVGGPGGPPLPPGLLKPR